MLLGFVNAPLDIPDRFEILVEFALISGAQAGFHTREIGAHIVEDGTILPHALMAHRRIGCAPVAKQPLENRARADLHRVWCRRTPPGDRVGISATISGVATACEKRFFDADFE